MHGGRGPVNKGRAMPHLTIEYSANIEENADLPALCAVMRDAMVETGVGRIVFSSTRATYGDQDGVLLNEESPQAPIKALLVEDTVRGQE